MKKEVRNFQQNLSEKFRKFKNQNSETLTSNTREPVDMSSNCWIEQLGPRGKAPTKMGCIEAEKKLKNVRRKNIFYSVFYVHFS